MLKKYKYWNKYTVEPCVDFLWKLDTDFSVLLKFFFLNDLNYNETNVVDVEFHVVDVEFHMVDVEFHLVDEEFHAVDVEFHAVDVELLLVGRS